MSLENVFKLSVIVNMIDRMTGPSSKIGKTIDENASKIDKFNAKMDDLKDSGVRMAATGTGIIAVTTGLAKSTFGTSNALGDLAAVGVENFEVLRDAATDFSDTWAGTSKAEFLAAANDIKSGIYTLSDEGVAKYTELAGLTGKATKSSIATMTDLFATGYGIYKGYYADLSDMEFGEIFSAAIAESANLFKSDGSKMASAISTLGAAATSAQVPMEEQLSVLGMLQATMSGSESGTKYRAFLQSAAKAGDELGISFLDANKQLLGMPEILQKLKDKYGETLDATEKRQLQTAFGTDEAVALIDLLYSKTGDLQGNIEEMYKVMGQGSAAVEEVANKVNSTDPAKWEIMTQKFQNMKESLGTLLLPVLMDFVNSSSNAIDKVTAFAESHQKLAGFILRVIVALGIMLTAVGGVMIVVGGLGMVLASLMKTITALNKGFGTITKGLSKGIPIALKLGNAFKLMGLSALKGAGNAAKGLLLMARQAIITAATALPALISSVWAFTVALLANPITWIVIGIMALIAAIIYLYRHWDQVTAFMKIAWQGFCNGITAGIAFIKNGFTAIVTFITGKLAWFRQSGKKIISTLAAGIKSAAGLPVQAIKGIFSKVRQYLPFSDAKVGPLSQLTLSGSRVITTMVSGMQKVENLPAEQTAKTFAKVPTAQKREIKKINLKGESSETSNTTTSDNGKRTIIQKLNINVKLDEIEDIKKFKKLLEQIEDMNNSSDNDDDEDLVFS